MQKLDIKTITEIDADFPEVFRHLVKPPKLFFVAGDTNLLKAKHTLSIVGSRRATEYGREVTEMLSRKLAMNGAIVVSGLAYGIDTIALRSAVSVGGRVIAVLPSCLERIYPAVNSHLAMEIVRKGGLLISEHASNPSPQKFQFIERNRLVAALGNVLLVTEAASNSGCNHTVRFAQELNKTVSAVPGNITSPTSAGTNGLIYDGAHPILEYRDLLILLGLKDNAAKPRYFTIDNTETLLLHLLEKEPSREESMQKKTGIGSAKLNATLTILEIKGFISRAPGGIWRLVS